MKVKELKDFLEKVGDDTKVYIYSHSVDEYYDVDAIRVDSESDCVIDME